MHVVSLALRRAEAKSFVVYRTRTDCFAALGLCYASGTEATKAYMLSISLMAYVLHFFVFDGFHWGLVLYCVERTTGNRENRKAKKKKTLKKAVGA